MVGQRSLLIIYVKYFENAIRKLYVFQIESSTSSQVGRRILELVITNFLYLTQDRF